MTKQFKIKLFDDLIDFIENEEASPKDIEHIISTTIGAYLCVSDYKDKRELIKDIKTYWNKYKNRLLMDRPLFLNR